MSGAEPCTGSKVDGHDLPGFWLALGASPIPPIKAAPMSVKLSPNRFDHHDLVTIRLRHHGAAMAIFIELWGLINPGFVNHSRETPRPITTLSMCLRHESDPLLFVSYSSDVSFIGSMRGYSR